MEEEKDCTTCRHHKDAGLTEWFECDRDLDKPYLIRKYNANKDTRLCDRYEVRNEPGRNAAAAKARKE